MGDQVPRDRVTVAVCVITYRRPVGLARLLEAFAKLEIDDTIAPTIVVVDNDPEGSARPAVDCAALPGRLD
jgi:hypothetical protein